MQLHNDEQTVNRIVDLKTRCGDYKEHPDAPGDASAMLFYCVVDMEKIEEDEYQETLDLTVSGEASGEQARMINKNHIYQTIPWSVFWNEGITKIGVLLFLIVFSW